MVSLYKIVNEYGLRLAFCLGKVQVKSPFLEILACADADFFPWEIVVISCVGSTTFPRCEVVILEGIMYDEWYSPLFKTANELYGMDIYAYYFDIPFEETVRRHNTRDKKQEFGEEDMRRWWREKDFSSVFNEKIITSDIDADSIVEMIYMDSANEG